MRDQGYGKSTRGLTPSRENSGGGRPVEGRRSILVVGAALLIIVSATPAAAADEATIQLYKTKCQACHMADGNSPIPEMSFAGGSWVHGSRLADVVRVIEAGVPGKAMVGFKEQLTREQIEALARHVRSFDKKLKADKSGKGGR